MAATQDNSLPALLSNLTASLTSASELVPDQDSTIPPKDGISLLDVKNELLLSYLQNLVFLILLKLRNTPAKSAAKSAAKSDSDEAVVKKLVELRLYLEKGVRPLEGRLKYQVDKVVRAAEDAARAEAQKDEAAKPAAKKKATSEDASDDESGSGSDEDEDADIDELAYRPNPLAFARPAAAAEESKKAAREEPSDGIYRPPRITATAMPEFTTRGREEKGAYKPAKSATLDEFIATELSGAPLAQPSIGSNVEAGGRRTKSAREREEEAERRNYEESNFVRLPKESKKDRAKKRDRGAGGYGGEDWRGLGAGIDRIERLTSKKERGGTAGALDRSRKRAVDDGPRGSGEGAQAGAMFAKRRKVQSRRK
ncbi:uncharacterized protein K452DRAFT_323374 [Aplosporella prunicola CBS 121167]|uniref:Sas10 C-terminal domain-containing protein n=1 Tax=Aplosporella prunicola CBS 121167 TaxID=1176127 RepID=A0A6A6BVA1_9PEZI|nr:uncharacterized protein K452DRAFT_323374 [Aplosporella prunicola CBS 121167]KAF2147195.1 hypothetical protein K452DRAFT_323374 [Aplosporella prunicola CBS 121167]